MGNQNMRHVLLECQLLEKLRYEPMNELFEAGVSMTLREMLKEIKAAPIVAKFMMATGLLGEFQSVHSVAAGKEQGKGTRIFDKIQQQNQFKKQQVLEK